MRFYAALHAASSAVKSAALCGAMLWLLVMTNFGSALAQTPPAGQPQPLHVLVIHSYHAGYGSSDAVMKGIENSFHGAAEEVELFIEYLDAKRLLDQSYLEQLHRILAFKYSRLRIDLVIASDNDALEFILKNRSTICAEKPVVFAGVSDFMPSMLAGQANITGVVEASEYRANIELAQKILPHLTEIVVISDRTTTGRIHETAFRKTAGQMPGLPRITYLSFSDFLLPELLERLKLLPSTAAVMLLHHSVDRDANTYTNKQSITAITSAAPAPVFVLTEDRVDYGTLGGRVVSGYLQGKTAAEMALHILRGEPIETIPVLTDSPNRHVFDYNTLARFEIPLSYLPAHSKITNQPRSFYARNKTAVWSVCLTILILSSAVLALALNILRRKRAEHELVEQRAKLSSTLQSITDGVIAVDRNKKILLLNRAAEQLTGCKQEEVAGQAISSLLTVKDESTRQHCAHLLARVLESAETVPHNRCVFVRRDGSELLVSVSAAPIKGGASTVDGAVIAFRDITTEARAQMELERAARLESVGVLAGGLAHDFNNLLTAIAGNAGLAQSAVGAGSSDDARRYLRNLETASIRARELTQQLLTFAKGGAPVRKLTALAPLLHDAGSFALAGSHNRLHLQVDSLWPAHVDSGQITQVLHNLLINADQAMPTPGQLVLRAENVMMDHSHSLPLSPGAYVKISIIDEGVGMPPEMLSRIFDPFFTTKQRGSGLGLASAHSIVKAHDGCITVNSIPGRGSIFAVFLPAQPEAACEAGNAAEARPPKKSLRVLVLEDDAMIREVLTTMLERLGHYAIAAEDGTTALAHVESALAVNQQFDLAILDLIVPGGMGGAELLKTLNERGITLKAIASSGYSTDAVMSDHQNFGFAGVLAKPYRMDDLEDLLNKIA